MAKVRASYGSSFGKCLFGLVIFAVICTALSDDFNDVTSVRGKLLYRHQTKVVDQLNRRHRRDTTLLKSTPASNNVTSVPTQLETFSTNNSTNKSKSIDPIITIKPTQSLLGVNGTDQRKNITELTLKQASVQNISASVNTAVKNVTPLGNTETPPDLLTDGFPPDDLDTTFENTKNITVKTDTHVFYNSTIYNDPELGKEFWVDMSKRTDVRVNDLLSSSHRRAATIKLSFEFPFYGHYIKNVTVATGGFLYTGNYVHSWLAATQYIAPLMANFDTGLSNSSYIKFADNGTSFTVEWDRVLLQDKPGEGEFTFQTTLHQNGDIVFVYNNVPLLIKDINDDHHPVKVGLSDAYILDKTVFYVRRKTIYEYHRVAFKREEIRNWTAIYLKALPNCLDFRDCTSCVLAQSLECQWCPSLDQCSTGKDRNRQDWIDKGCDLRNISKQPMCDAVFEEKQYKPENGDSDYIGKVAQQSQLGTSGYIAVIFLIAMISGFGFWTAYAYRNPHTTSGQMLIRYRPSQWRWRRGEARYTAATIHM